MSLFLPREIGSIETGPQTFAGTNVLNTTFNFIKKPLEIEGPGLLNSVLVQGAGLNTLNGIFTYTLLFNNKPYYNKDGNSDWFILWFQDYWAINYWGIYDFSINSIEPIYFSFENTLYPWNVTTWTAYSDPLFLPYNPVPNVSKIL